MYDHDHLVASGLIEPNRRWLLAPLNAAVAVALLGLAGCDDPEDKADAGEECMDVAAIEWQLVQNTSTTYIADDDTLGYGHYPEGPTESMGSACVAVYEPLTCNGETTHIVLTTAHYAGDTHIDAGAGDFRIASVTFAEGSVRDSVPIQQFNVSGTTSSGTTPHFNGDRPVPDFISVVSSYPLSTAPTDANAGAQECGDHALATFSLE